MKLTVIIQNSDLHDGNSSQGYIALSTCTRKEPKLQVELLIWFILIVVNDLD